LLLISEKVHLLVIDGGTDASPSNPRNARPDGQRAAPQRTQFMTRNITSILLAAFVAGTTTIAFASDNGEGSRILESIRATQRADLQRSTVTYRAPVATRYVMTHSYAADTADVFDSANHSARSSK
jgi:hypothetical protein